MNVETIDKLKEIFFKVVKLDGYNDFEKLLTMTESFIEIMKTTEFDNWKSLDITIQRRELFGKVSTYINIMKYMAMFFEEDLKISL